MAAPGFVVTIHNSLTQPMLTAGVPRQFFIINATAMAAITFGMQSLYGIPICGVLHVVAVMMTKKDPYFFTVMVRHIKKKGYYTV